MTTPQQPYVDVSKGPVPSDLAEELHRTLQVAWSSLDRIVNGHGSLIIHANPSLIMDIEHARQIAAHVREVLSMINEMTPGIVTVTQEARK